MAIDSRDKRASASSDGMPWDEELFVPDGVMTQADRQEATQTYRGILASGPPSAEIINYPWWLIP